MSTIPEPIWLFRITHIQNLSHILKHGIATARSERADPGYKSIGNSTLINSRNSLKVPDPTGVQIEVRRSPNKLYYDHL